MAAAAVRHLVAAADELGVVRDDLDRLPVVAVLVLELAPLQAAVDGDRAALGHVLGDDLALATPDGDVDEVALLAPLARRRILLARVERHAQAADRHAARQGAKLRAQVRRPDRTTLLM